VTDPTSFVSIAHLERFSYTFNEILPSVANMRGKWPIANAKKRSRDLVELVWPRHLRGVLLGLEFFAVSVAFTRFHTRGPGLDSEDNLTAAFKAARDELTRQVGLKNDNDPRIVWTYAQCRATPAGWGFDVSISASDLLLPKAIPPRAPPKQRKNRGAARATPNTHPPRRP